MELEIHDTSGEDERQSNRLIQYANADVFMICVPVAMKNKGVYQDSYEYEASIAKWLSEIKTIHKDKPVFLVLTQRDLL